MPNAFLFMSTPIPTGVLGAETGVHGCESRKRALSRVIEGVSGNGTEPGLIPYGISKDMLLSLRSRTIGVTSSELHPVDIALDRTLILSSALMNRPWSGPRIGKLRELTDDGVAGQPQQLTGVCTILGEESAVWLPPPRLSGAPGVSSVRQVVVGTFIGVIIAGDGAEDRKPPGL